jgi:hypothetical protein
MWWDWSTAGLRALATATASAADPYQTRKINLAARPRRPKPSIPAVTRCLTAFVGVFGQVMDDVHFRTPLRKKWL